MEFISVFPYTYFATVLDYVMISSGRINSEMEIVACKM